MKQVILMRTDLGMSTGKMCAQAAHSAGGKSIPRVVLKVTDLEQLRELSEKARAKRLEVRTVTDAGNTEVPPGTWTCTSITGDETKINSLTGALPLL